MRHENNLPPKSPKKRESTSPFDGEPAASITTLSSKGPLRVPTSVLSLDALDESSKITLLAEAETTNSKLTITRKENILLVKTTFNWLDFLRQSTTFIPWPPKGKRKLTFKISNPIFWGQDIPLFIRPPRPLVSFFVARGGYFFLYIEESRWKRLFRWLVYTCIGIFSRDFFQETQVPWRKVKVFGVFHFYTNG